MPTDRTREELVISIPLDVEEGNEESATYDTIIQPQPFNDNPEEIDFPLEYFTNPEQNVTSLSLNKLLKTSSWLQDVIQKISLTIYLMRECTQFLLKKQIIMPGSR